MSNQPWSLYIIFNHLSISKWTENNTKMKVKVQPNGNTSELQKRSSSSKFTRFIRLTSNVYVLPIEYKNDFKEVDFSLISLRTFISFTVTSIPFLFACIWWFIFQWDFTSQYFEKSLHIYHLFDFSQMFVLNFNIINPFSLYPVVLWICHIWASLPELSQE